MPDESPQKNRDVIISSYRLTEQETIVLEYLGKGYSNEGMSREMGVEIPLIEGVVGELKRKTGISDRRLLVKMGLWLVLDRKPEFDQDEAKPQVFQCPNEPKGCGEIKDISAFPFWPADLRCGACIQMRVETSKQAARRRRAEAAVKEFSKALREKQVNLPHISKALGEFMDEDGGYKAFIRNYAQQIKMARENNPGSKFSLDHHRDIMRLWKEVSAIQTTDKTIETMNMEEVQEYMVELMFKELGKAGRERIVGLYMEEEDGEAGDSTSAAG